MKKFMLLLITSTILIIGYGQEKNFNIDDELEIIDKLVGLKLNKLTNAEKRKIGFFKPNSITNMGPYKWQSGGLIKYESNKSVIAILNFRVSAYYEKDKLLGICIGLGTHKKIFTQQQIIRRFSASLTFVDTCLPSPLDQLYCFQINVLNKPEMDLVNSLGLDSSFKKEILHEYFDFGYGKELYDSLFAFPRTDNNLLSPEQKNPSSEVIKKLIRCRKYKEAFELCHLANKTYGWFLAEGVVHYNKKLNFLNKEQLDFLNNCFNGNNGFIKFRAGKTEEEAYPDL